MVDLQRPALCPLVLPLPATSHDGGAGPPPSLAVALRDQAGALLPQLRPEPPRSQEPSPARFLLHHHISQSRCSIHLIQIQLLLLQVALPDQAISDPRALPAPPRPRLPRRGVQPLHRRCHTHAAALEAARGSPGLAPRLHRRPLHRLRRRELLPPTWKRKTFPDLAPLMWHYFGTMIVLL
ncbi:hypothetical protein PVAP13_1NG246557 [Panicum virgatum]|uniref:Uncharacterized protein n=1 Tax=Panicum virgatum TaxID=38727 RepID=A0A8T0WXR4_PANVG|nr:hypothetical protein PVAP13_1NG246557 [Panicum virgatum]KAG2651128.1 hypothetical protein PVAP13_1NG246557 [Panicum virgatum]